VRLLVGAGAVSSGQTIYDAAITNTGVDEALGMFDPFFQINNNWDYIDQPRAAFNPATGSFITGVPVDQYRMNMALTKNNPLGGQWNLGVDVTQQRFPGGLAPSAVFPFQTETAANTALGYNQPLLRGFGMRANLAPVVLARINTERSFFQLKDTLQQNVRDVITAYWNLVAARATANARQLQVDSLDFEFRRLDAQRRLGLGNLADAAQARVALYQARAQLLAAQNDVLQREAALRNLLGLPPWDDAQIIPSTEPVAERLQPQWQELVDLAAARRPDLVELKLILEADEQQRIVANNNALPQLNAAALYRWNGLDGELPGGNGIATAPGQFADWTLGVNFSVPIGLRSARANLRQAELIIARDRANLDQGLHAASHALATTIRSLDQAYEQYLAFSEARAAALENYRQQTAARDVGRTILLNVLIAISDLANNTSNQAQALTIYNSLLAELELQTGTILETHGVRFFEERYGSIGPLGRLAQPVCYPQSTPPTPNYDRYPIGNQPAEHIFNVPEAIPQRAPRAIEDLPPLTQPPGPPPLEPATIREPNR
jgi:outer membrane protein TolC